MRHTKEQRKTYVSTRAVEMADPGNIGIGSRSNLRSALMRVSSKRADG